MRAADFETVLRTPSFARSAHFALHHVAAPPSLPKRSRTARLSTAFAPTANIAVDNSCVQDQFPAVNAGLPARRPPIFLGTVVAKRHARRAVTRTLLKREIRVAVAQNGLVLPAGMWVVRLRNPIDRTLYKSATSDALQHVIRAELASLLATAVAKAASVGRTRS